MPSYPTWDWTNLHPADFTLECMGQAFEGGRSLTGITYAIDYTGGGIWRIGYGRVQLFEGASHRAWLAAAGLMNGGVNPINVLVPVGWVNPFTAGPHDPTIDGSPAEIKAQMSDGRALYSTDLQISVIQGTALKAGHLFSINHSAQGWRLYQIIDVLSATDIPTTDTDAIRYHITIRPPLRQETAQGTKLEMDWPRCVMRLVSGQNMVWSPSEYWRSTPSVSFIEYFIP